jgi:hypothetical protein
MNDPDLTVVVYGRSGVGKSALVGEIAELVLACGGEVECLRGEAGGPKRRVRVPDPDCFHKPLKVRFVEQVGDKTQEGKTQDTRREGRAWR